ncbi:MA2B1-like protein, partial [Mya arenaria]
FYTVTVSRETGRITRLWNKAEDVAVSLKQDLFYYIGHDGYNYDAATQASGAYIFRPLSNTPKKANAGKRVAIVAYKGGHVQEIRQVFCDWISQVIRLYDNSSHVEIEWTVGPIPAERNLRETWTLNQTERVSGNYYPVTSRTSLRDDRRGLQFTVMVDRSEGAASIVDGQLELMKLFRHIEIVEIFELSLGANMRMSDIQTLKWRTKEKVRSTTSRERIALNNGRTVELVPMEIRTFQINVKR